MNTTEMNCNEKMDTRQEEFKKGFDALRKNDSNYLGIISIDNRVTGKLDVYDQSDVQNAYIYVKKGNTHVTWTIQDGKIKTFPQKSILWFKSQKKMALYASNDNEERFYIFFGNKNFPFPTDWSILGIIENEDYCFAFYVDDKSEQILCVQDHNDSDHSALFQILQHVQDIEKKEVRIHESFEPLSDF